MIPQDKKTRADAKLGTLPEPRQDAIVEYARDHTLAATLQWLHDDGLDTSSGALSQFLSSRRLQSRLDRNAAVAERLKAEIKSEKPGLTPEELDFIGQKFFTELAIDEADSLSWQRAQNVKIKQGRLDLDRDKHEFNAAKAALAAVKELKVISASKLSDTEKINAARRALFGELPEDPD